MVDDGVGVLVVGILQFEFSPASIFPMYHMEYLVLAFRWYGSIGFENLKRCKILILSSTVAYDDSII